MFDFFTQRQDSSKPTLFYVPTPDPFENPLVETNPSSLRQWATALPFATPDQLSEAVLASLARLNRFPGSLRKRDELMRVYYTPVLRLLHGSAARKRLAPLPILRRVMQEMAFGYSHIANECLLNKASKKNLERLTHALYHAIKFYLQEFLYACEEYDCRAMHSYREISRLRTYAEEQRIHNTPVVEEEDPENTHTIAELYNLFLLLRLLDPCHLQEGETRVCFNYLESLAEYARFKPPERNVEPSGHYVIDRLGEVPPSLFEPDGLESLTQPRFTLFDLNPVSQQIHMQLRNLERSAEQKPEALAALNKHEITNLLARMLKAWHIRLQRDSERHTTSGRVTLWVGLHNIHNYLTRDTRQTDQEEAEESSEITLTHSRLQASSEGADKPQLVARRFNQSRSGVALQLSDAPLTPLVGELILINLQSGAALDESRVGIVKRALSGQEGALEIGVQFIQGRILPISLQHTPQKTESQPDEAEEAPVHPGLFIDQGHSHRSSLIVPKHFFLAGQEYRIEEMTPAPTITPLQILESTANFERYRVKAVS